MEEDSENGAYCEGNLQGGIICWVRLCRESLWRRASLSIGALLGNLEGGSFTRDFERRMKEGSDDGAYLSVGKLMRGPWREGSFNGTLKVMLSKDLATGNCLHKGPR
jgi:hypothetical protein